MGVRAWRVRGGENVPGDSWITGLASAEGDQQNTLSGHAQRMGIQLRTLSGIAEHSVGGTSRKAKGDSLWSEGSKKRHMHSAKPPDGHQCDQKFAAFAHQRGDAGARSQTMRHHRRRQPFGTLP